MVNIETTEQFNELIGAKLTIVDFWASWCAPCKMFAPIFENTAKEYPNINFIKVDVDKNAALAQAYQVVSIPTIMLFNEGKPIQKKVGFMPKVKFNEWINSCSNN